MGSKKLEYRRLTYLLNFNHLPRSFTWKNPPEGSGYKKGEQAGLLFPTGDRFVCLDGKTYREEDLEYLYLYGDFKGGEDPGKIVPAPSTSMSSVIVNGVEYVPKERAKTREKRPWPWGGKSPFNELSKEQELRCAGCGCDTELLGCFCSKPKSERFVFLDLRPYRIPGKNFSVFNRSTGRFVVIGDFRAFESIDEEMLNELRDSDEDKEVLQDFFNAIPAWAFGAAPQEVKK